jgi:hypothetical protein
MNHPAAHGSDRLAQRPDVIQYMNYLIAAEAE